MQDILKTSTLLRYIYENNLLVYADNYLLAEIHDALLQSFGFTVGEADKIIQLISTFINVNSPRNITGCQKMQRTIIYTTCAYKTIAGT